jgi:hypothetical protein
MQSVSCQKMGHIPPADDRSAVGSYATPSAVVSFLILCLSLRLALVRCPSSLTVCSKQVGRTLAETKIGRLVYSNSPLGGTVIRILRFFVALYLLFLLSHKYRTKQNRSLKLLLNVRMQYALHSARRE